MQHVETVSSANIKETSSALPTGPRLASEPCRALGRPRNLHRCFVFGFSVPSWKGFRFRFEIHVSREHQLEGPAGDSGSSVLSDNQETYYGNEKGGSMGTAVTRDTGERRGKGHRAERLSMPVLEIQPQRYRKILYENPRRGRRLNIEVEATAALDIFIVPVSALEAWRRGSRDYEGDGFLRRKTLQIQLGSEGREFDREWYLILDNRSDRAVSASYSVKEA